MKRFKAILAAALAGCLLMAFTACSGRNNNTTGGVTIPSPNVNVSDAADAEEESITEKLRALAEGAEGEALISSLESSSGNTATGSLEVEGNTLVVICTYQEEIPEESIDTVSEYLDSALETLDESFQPMVAQLCEEVGGEVQLRVEYRTMDGESLASRTFTQGE